MSLNNLLLCDQELATWHPRGFLIRKESRRGGLWCLRFLCGAEWKIHSLLFLKSAPLSPQKLLSFLSPEWSISRHLSEGGALWVQVADTPFSVANRKFICTWNSRVLESQSPCWAHPGVASDSICVILALGWVPMSQPHQAAPASAGFSPKFPAGREHFLWWFQSLSPGIVYLWVNLGHVVSPKPIIVATGWAVWTC